jgi:Fe-S-cluster containining protein
MYAQLGESEKQYLLRIHMRARAVFADVLRDHGSVSDLAGAIAAARISFMDAELRPIIDAMARTATPVECRAGCSVCCSLEVEITPDEAMAVAKYLEETLPDDELNALRDAALAAEQRGAGLGGLERHARRISCPVLDRQTGSCRAHARRPGPCQGYLSLSRRACEAASGGNETEIPIPTASELIRDAVMSAQTIVLQEAGFDQTRRELSAALNAIWQDDAFGRRWLERRPA